MSQRVWDIPIIRERGITEHINGNSLDAMDGTGPMGNAVVLFCFRGVACRPLPVGSGEQDMGRKPQGGRSPRGGIEVILPSEGHDNPAGEENVKFRIYF